MATLCFCPPDNLMPRSPTTVLYWSGKLDMKSCAFAIFCIQKLVRSCSLEVCLVFLHSDTYGCFFNVSRASFALQSVSNILFNGAVKEHRLLANYAYLKSFS